MFGKKKEPRRQPRPAGSLAQYGIFEVPDAFDDIGGGLMRDDDNDEDLEAELAALTAGDDSGLKRKVQRKPVPDETLNAMVAESMKDVNFDEDDSEGENDPDILNELKLITGDESGAPEESCPDNTNEEPQLTNENNVSNAKVIQLLEERLKMYETAEAKAERDNEKGRLRRFNRGVKTIKELLSSAHAGKHIDDNDIPPVLPPSATSDSERPKGSDVSPTKVDTLTTSTSEETVETAQPVIDSDALDSLKKRQQEYKIAALKWKKSGNMEQALQNVKIAKQFDTVIAAVTAGETIDLSDMPPSPSLPSTDASQTTVQSPEKVESEAQKTPSTDTVPLEAQTHHGHDDIGLALKERLEVYRRTKTAAETEGNASKARRYGRICKQFEDALKLHARGKTVPLDELPVPPGFPPLTSSPKTDESVPETAKAQPQSKPADTQDDDTKTTRKQAPPVPPQPTIAKRPNQKITSRAEKQSLLLLQRQHELKQAALAAKKDGDLELARDYLRQAKGMQPLIEASNGGLPVDMNSIPLSPIAKMELNAHGLTEQTDDNFTLLSSEDCLEEAGGTDEQIYENLETQLIKQIKWCLATRDHSKALGDVPGYNRWERLALSYTRDLDMLRVRKRDSLPPPQHHYETKTYAIVQSCTDLNDGDVEISIIRGVNFSREADTYVMYEFPYPSDNSPSDRTSTVKGTNNPEYEAVFHLTNIIDRNSRQCQRSFKRHALKCQVWAKGGFLRSDSLLGTVTIKLQPLEAQCILHDSFPLMDGRKPTGGKLEVKIRLRNPILTKQIEQITDKWLTIDQ